MNDESGTNALTAPAVVLAVAEENPTLLVPVIPDLVRLSADEDLRPDLASALSIVVDRCPGELGRSLTDAVNTELRRRGRRHA